MQRVIQFLRTQRYAVLTAGVLLALCSVVSSNYVYANEATAAQNGRLITIHDRGGERVILTHTNSIRDAMQDAHITLASKDIIEPGLDSQLVATSYVVNIYRARPVIVVDGLIKEKIMTASQTPRDIVTAAGITELHDEDRTTMAASSDIAADGASTVLTVDRAIPFTLLLYGTPTQAYSHAKTVREMLNQKGVALSPQDSVSVSLDIPLTAGMTVAIWRNGVQTATVEEQTAFSVRQILDVDEPFGYHKVQTPGVKGVKSVTYEITAQDGHETGRKLIQSVTVTEPKEQVEVVGAKSGPNALTQAKGSQQFTDSKGVTHRETYYDLNMNSVIGACGGGGYTIRADGAKVDRDGYILIAANLANYPRCTVVETSMGPGKVYDTGGFAARYPQGFDLATDWSNHDGR